MCMWKFAVFCSGCGSQLTVKNGHKPLGIPLGSVLNGNTLWVFPSLLCWMWYSAELWVLPLQPKPTYLFPPRGPLYPLRIALGSVLNGFCPEWVTRQNRNTLWVLPSLLLPRFCLEWQYPLGVALGSVLPFGYHPGFCVGCGTRLSCRASVVVS